MLTGMQDSTFTQLIFDFYSQQGRDALPWRHLSDAYKVLVSEVMLQQTQAERVVPKYLAFLEAFPTAQSLATARSEDVLRLWQGLGYNRRALSLQKAAKHAVETGGFPTTVEGLQDLPGVGPYTAGAVVAFAYNKPVTMIETNIRRVYLHHYFPEAESVSDKDLMPMIERTVDKANPREWYYALMDYGAWLAKQLPNANRRSKHYVKQSKFEGSLRQLRGKLVKLFLEEKNWEVPDLVVATGDTPERIEKALTSLIKEGFPVPANLASIRT
ncbi:endonuclease III [soil metagenome]